MDAQLQELIETIKTEGVQTAEKQADQIVASAEEKALQIIADAEKRARGLIEDARAEQAKLDQSGRESLKQAGRDLILGVQAKLTAMFKAVVNAAAGEAIAADILENTMVTVVNASSRGFAADSPNGSVQGLRSNQTMRSSRGSVSPRRMAHFTTISP